MSDMKRVKLVGVLVVLLLGAVGCGESQSSEIDQLNRKVAELDRENQQLWEQADLHKKEPWRSLANWNRIRLDMTRNQVLDILGHPRTTSYTGPGSYEWVYGLKPPPGHRTGEWYCSVSFKTPVSTSGRPLSFGHPPILESIYAPPTPPVSREPLVDRINPPSELR